MNFLDQFIKKRKPLSAVWEESASICPEIKCILNVPFFNTLHQSGVFLQSKLIGGTT